MSTGTQQIVNYLEYLRSEKQYSKHTLSNYKRQLESALDSCKPANNGWQKVDIHQYRQLLAEWHRSGLSVASINQRLSALRGLYKHLIREGQAKNNPLKTLSAPKTKRRLPKDVSIDDVFRLLDNMPRDEPLAIRDHAMLELFYSCGLRLAELADLDIQDIDLNEQVVNVLGKGSKQRQVPVGSKAIKALQLWLEIRVDFIKEPTEAIFLSKPGHRMSHRNIQARMKHWGQQLGIASHLHPHKLRHSFATHMLEGSGDLRSVQKLLGHANMSTTQVYTHLDFQHLAKVYDNAHPRSKKKS